METVTFDIMIPNEDYELLKQISPKGRRRMANQMKDEFVRLIRNYEVKMPKRPKPRVRRQMQLSKPKS